MLAGRPPFRSKSLPEMLQMQRQAEPPPVSRFAQDVPQELERIIGGCCQKPAPNEAPTPTCWHGSLRRWSTACRFPSARSDRDEESAAEAFSSFASAKTVPDQGKTPPLEYDPNAPTRIAEPSASPPPLRPPITVRGEPATVRPESSDCPIGRAVESIAVAQGRASMPSQIGL